MNTKTNAILFPRVRPSALRQSSFKDQHRSVDTSHETTIVGDLVGQAVVPNLGVLRKGRRFSSVNSPLDSSKLQKRKNSLSYKPTMLPNFEFDFHYTIHIMSNWGDPNEITVSEIDFLSETKTSLKVTKVSPDIPTEDKNSFALMANGILVKNNDKERWIHSWYPNQEPIVVHFTVSSIRPPQYIRIWNTEDRPERNMKKFAVFVDSEFVGAEEVPLKFGVVLPLSQPVQKKEVQKTESVLKLFNFTTYFDDLYKDVYGTLPIKKTQNITIVIHRPYDKTSDHIGLNSIDIFDCKGNVITKSDIKFLKIDGATNFSSPMNVFKENKYNSPVNEIWIAEKKVDVDIYFSIDLQVPTQLAMIRFWNFNLDENSYNLGVSDVSIFLNEVLACQRRLSKADGPIYRKFKGITDIWLAQSNRLKELPAIADIYNIIPEE